MGDKGLNLEGPFHALFLKKKVTITPKNLTKHYVNLLGRGGYGEARHVQDPQPYSNKQGHFSA